MNKKLSRRWEGNLELRRQVHQNGSDISGAAHGDDDTLGKGVKGYLQSGGKSVSVGSLLLTAKNTPPDCFFLKSTRLIQFNNYPLPQSRRCKIQYPSVD